MFNITGANGFHVTFANGITVSVQWGYGTHCDNKWVGTFSERAECANAEIAVWDKDGNWIKCGDNDDVRGWVTPEQLAEVMAAMSVYEVAPKHKGIEFEREKSITYGV